MISQQVRILSDGTGMGTRVTDMDGNAIPNVSSVSIRISPNEPIVADIETVLPKVDVTAVATLTSRCPYCGHSEDDDI